MAAGRPDLIILQHAPSRKEYDGFPGYRMHPLNHQILAIELISGKKVTAITVNHENMRQSDIRETCAAIKKEYGIPAFDVLEYGAEDLMPLLQKNIRYDYVRT